MDMWCYRAGFAEQVGLPFPATPFLLAAGALAGRGHLSFGCAWPLCGGGSACRWLGSSLAGRRVSGFFNFSAESPWSRTRVCADGGVFAKQGARSLLVAKFVPGLSTAAPPLAGIFHMRRRRFLLWDFLGSVLWPGVLLLGYIFSEQIEVIAERAASSQRIDGADCGSAGGYITWKFIGRRRFLRELRIGRITPEELKEKIDAREELVIVTCATPSISKPTGDDPGRVSHGRKGLGGTKRPAAAGPRDHPLLYLTKRSHQRPCGAAPQKQGIKRIRPLEGGLDGWREAGFGLQAAVLEEQKQDSALTQIKT